MGPQEEPASFDPKSASGEGRKTKASASAEQPAPGTLVSFTVEAQTGRIVKVESVDPGGARQELTEEARAALARDQARATVEGVVEQAFEAGIDCVLGAEDEDAPESDEDADLRRMLLRSLIQRSAARLVERDVLRRAIVGSLIRQAASASETAAEGAARH